MKKFDKRAITLAVLAVGLAATTTVSAQGQARSTMLEEVIVTAQKREQGLQEVPISVQAFSQERIDALSAQDIGDLGYFTPNVTISLSANQPSYKIRGIGTSDFGVGADPAVGVYVDGVYIARSGGSKVAFNDVQRIEILNGPQGTLFGRNAAAGAIQYIMNKPVEGTEGWVKATAGNHDRMQVEGVYNMALTDNVFWRTGVLKNQRDGFVDNYYNGKDLKEQDNWSVTSSLRWLPSDKLDIIFRGEYDKVDQDARPATSALYGPRKGKAFDGTSSTSDNESTRDLWGASLHVIYDLPLATFTSISSFRHYETENPEDQDGWVDPLYEFDDYNSEDNDQWSQEFRFNGELGTKLLWTVGINYARENAKQTSGLNLNTHAADKLILEAEAGFQYNEALSGSGFDVAFSPISPFASFPRAFDNGQEAVAAGIYSESIDVEGEYESWAAFADVTYSITETLDITAGIRYTDDEKDFDRTVALNDFGIFFAFTPTVIGEDGQLIRPSDEGGPDDWYDQGAPGTYSQTQSWDDTTGRVVLDWHVADDVLVYASYAEGYKAGGFNSAGLINAAPAFDPEEVTNYELGIKSTWFDNTLRINAAYFDYDYDNLQELQFIEGECLGGGFGSHQFVTSDVEGDGYELSLNWLATPGLELWANVGAVDSDLVKADRCTVIDGQPITEDESGDKFVDQWSYSLGASYHYEPGFGGDIMLSVAWAWEEGSKNRQDCKFLQDLGDGTSAIYLLEEVNNQLVIATNSSVAPLTEVPIDSCPNLDDTEQLNARLAYTSASGDWEVGAWITNATDWEEDDDPGGLGDNLRTPWSDGAYSWDRREQPRMYGLDLKYTF